MADRIPSELSELAEAASAYAAKLNETIAECESQVQKWFPANECMVQIFPLHEEAVTVGSDRWYTTKAAWYRKDEAGHFYQHGFDDHDRIRIVHYDTQVLKVFVHGGSFLDELVLAGDSFRGVIRYLFKDGRLTSSRFVSWPGLSVTCTDFKYEGDTVSELRSRYSQIDQPSGSISTNELVHLCLFRWDDATPTRQLVDVTSNYGEILYVGYQHRKLVKQSVKPLVAFSLAVDDLGDESDGDGLAGQCYSLEMTADFDWQFDRVLLCLPEAISKVTEGSDVCSTGLDAGGVDIQTAGEIQAVAEQGGKWLWIDSDHGMRDLLLHEAEHNQMKVLLCVTEKALTDSNHLTSAARFACVDAIVCDLKETTPAKLAAVVRTIRKTLPSTWAHARVLVKFNADCGTELINFLEATGADGVTIERVDLATIIKLLNQVGLHSYTTVPVTVDSRHVLSGRLSP